MAWTKHVPAGSPMERTRAQRSGPWHGAVGLFPLALALGLWAYVLAGVTAPLGDAVARIDRDAALDDSASGSERALAGPAACTIPDDALAFAGPEAISSSEPPLDARTCQ